MPFQEHHIFLLLISAVIFSFCYFVSALNSYCVTGELSHKQELVKERKWSQIITISNHFLFLIVFFLFLLLVIILYYIYNRKNQSDIKTVNERY